MIFPADRPLEGACSSVRALYVALNSPVVRQEPLPVGPASAAVALHARADGVSVVLRSVRTGQRCFFTSRPEQTAAELALDAALSFAEALGFVFDENEVAPDGAGAQAAARLWCELIGETPEPQGDTTDPVSALFPDPAESHPEGNEVAFRDLLVAATESAVEPDPSRILSKFRWLAAPALAPEQRSS